MQRARPALAMPRPRPLAGSTWLKPDLPERLPEEDPTTEDTLEPTDAPGRQALNRLSTRCIEEDDGNAPEPPWDDRDADTSPETPDSADIGHDSPDATAVPVSTAVVPAPPRAMSEGDAMAAATAAAVAGISRTMQDSALVRSLAGYLIQTCGDPSYRETGPWEFDLPMDRVGLVDANVRLRLSSELLSLRFRCRSRETRALLFRHQNTLHSLLRDHLNPPIDIDIDVEISHG